MRKILFLFGLPLIVIGIVLHFYFLTLNVAYLETFSNQLECKVILSKISNNLNESLDNNCPIQLHLIQAAFVKLFLGLGAVLTIGASFLIYSGIDKKNKKLS